MTYEDVVDVLEDVALWNSLELQYANLQYANLLDADLRYANLQDANLRCANLRRADLRGADMRDADLRSANLQGADLQDANLRYLQDANLRYANLRYANLRRADLGGADLRYADLRYVNLGGADLKDANLRGANLQGADLRYANLSQSKGISCPTEFLSQFERDAKGLIVYRVWSGYHPCPKDWKCEPGAVLSETPNPDRGTECGCGVSFATRTWLRMEFPGASIWKCRIAWMDLATVVVPFLCDGKARCGRLTLLEEI